MKPFTIQVEHDNKPVTVRAVNVQHIVQKIKRDYISERPKTFHITNSKGQLVYVGLTEKIGRYKQPPKGALVKQEREYRIKTSWPKH